MKELQMKMTTKSVHLWRTVEGWLANPGFAHLMGSLRHLGLGFLLAGVSFFGSPMPVACAYIATAASPIFALAGLLGSAVGYLHFWGFGGGLEALALGVLIFATICTMGNSGLRSTSWFLPVATATLAAMVGLLYLVQTSLTVVTVAAYILKVFVSGGLVYGMQMAKKRKKSGYSLLFIGCCVAGCHGIPLVGGLTWGHFVAFFICAGAMGTTMALPFAVVLGLALDCASGATYQMTALLGMTALVCQAPGFDKRPVGQLALLAVTTLFALFSPTPILALVPGGAVAVCLSLAAPRGWFAQWGEGRSLSIAEAQLTGLSHVFQDLAQILHGVEAKETSLDMGAVFDLAAQEVCGKCPLWSQCWKQKSSETYRIFVAATAVIVKRGMALREDFPPEFAGYCTDFPRLLAHINTGLEGVSGKKQFQNRLEESRLAVANQYAFLADYCHHTGQQMGCATGKRQRFYPEVAVKSAKKTGNAVSGDRGTAFYCGEVHYCVILCDGMGSGQAAAEEAELAIATLRGLLQAGMPVQYGLELLNNLYVLRGTGCFSTVDLLWIDLSTAAVELYKWGTTSSYWKGDVTQKLGGVTPPPGLGVGEKHQAQMVSLTLERGQSVVLLSDGIEGSAMERLIGGWRECPPKELATAILEEAKTMGEDDMTAVVITLRQRSSDF